jgi:hypothetical protein
LAIENIPSKTSDVFPDGTVTDGAVTLVELALPWPLLASTGNTVLAPVYATIPPAASLPEVKLKV